MQEITQAVIPRCMHRRRLYSHVQPRHQALAGIGTHAIWQATHARRITPTPMQLPLLYNSMGVVM